MSQFPVASPEVHESAKTTSHVMEAHLFCKIGGRRLVSKSQIVVPKQISCGSAAQAVRRSLFSLRKGQGGGGQRCTGPSALRVHTKDVL
jgi:hypothetical protein